MKFIAYYWRSNPQHRYCGYDASKEFEAESYDDAVKKAKESEERVATGTLELVNIEQKED